MARTVTMQQLVDDARMWAGMRTSTPDDAHLTNTNVARIVALQLAELHEMLNSASASAFSEVEDAVTIVDGAGDLPDDFFTLERAWIAWSTSDHESMGNIEAAQDATVYQGMTWAHGSPKAFRVVGGQLRVFPPVASATIQIAYVPAFAEADEYDGVNGWEKMVTMGAAVEMLAIENRSNGSLEAKYEAQKERVLAMIEARQGQDAPRIRDVTPRRTLDDWP